VNIRAAAILGLVGAGGLGQQIHIAISLFLENQLLTLLIAIYIVVTVVDYLSAYLRSLLWCRSNYLRQPSRCTRSLPF